MDNEKFVMELFKEFKAASKRWFIAFLIMIGLEAVTIGGFLWYISLPIEETTTEYVQEAEDIDDSDVRQIINGKDWED